MSRFGWFTCKNFSQLCISKLNAESKDFCRGYLLNVFTSTDSISFIPSSANRQGFSLNGLCLTIDLGIESFLKIPINTIEISD